MNSDLKNLIQKIKTAQSTAVSTKNELDSITSYESAMCCINNLADYISYTPIISTLPSFDELVATAINLIEFFNKSNKNISNLNEHIKPLQDIFDKFIYDLTTYLKIKVYFSEEELEKLLTPALDSSILSTDNGIANILLYNSSSQTNIKYENIEFIQTINADDILSHLVDCNYKSKKHSYYTYLHNHSLSKHQNSYELFSTGSSYSLYGLDLDLLDYDTCDVSMRTKDLYYIKKSLDSALTENKSIKKCLFSISYYTLHYDLSKTTHNTNIQMIEDVFYPVYKDSHHCTTINKNINLAPNVDFLDGSLLLLFKKDLLSNIILDLIQNPKHKSPYSRFFNPHLTREAFAYFITEKSLLSEYNSSERELKIETVYLAHNKFLKYTDTYKEYRELLFDIIKTCSDNDIEPIFVIYPMPKLYTQNLNYKFKEIFYKEITELSQSFKFHLLDLFEDIDFTDNDFVDVHHLSTNGAKKATIKVNKFLKRCFSEN